MVSADLQKLLKNAAGDEKANKFAEIMNILGGAAEKKLNAGVLPMICNKLQETMPEKMQEKMGEKGLKCDILVKSDAEQADFYFDLISASAQ